MSSIDVVVECPVFDSFRVQQVAGMFDVPLQEKLSQQFTVELPGDSEDWQVGLIVGPSGSGKSTVARKLFARQLYQTEAWPSDRAVVDCFEELPTRKVVELFTAVGFGSSPAWVKPYHVLSCGERFRCDLAKALARADHDKQSDREAKDLPLVVFDEYTSVVDRHVAKACSHAVSKSIRNGNTPCRFIAVTCHYDVAQWLEADWVLDMATGTLQRRRLRRPAIELRIHRCRMAAWQLFKRHHYLTGTLGTGSRCFLATWDGEPVAFCATLPVIPKKNHRRFSRIVTLPDFQGMGIGMRVVAAVASLHRQEGHRINVTSSHPALIGHCKRSSLWKAINVKKTGSGTRNVANISAYRSSKGRAVVSFEYVGS
ncbi:MAG: GNAT family N-acetyltransferase [Planctomycetota bacterium]